MAARAGPRPAVTSQRSPQTFRCQETDMPGPLHEPRCQESMTRGVVPYVGPHASRISRLAWTSALISIRGPPHGSQYLGESYSPPQ
jgi:hypothetical protein